MKERREEKEEVEVSEIEEEESGGIAAGFHNLNIETAVTEEEAAEGLAAALEMEVEEDRGGRERMRVEGLNGHWKPLSYSLRKLSRVVLRSLMPVMSSTS